IEEVRDTAALRAFFRVIAPVGGFPDFAARAWLELHSAIGLDGPWRHFLGKVDGKPAAASSLFLGYRAAGIANVAVLPDARRRGIGTAISLSPLRLARRMGYRVATLFSSPIAEGMYRKLGFRKYCEGRGYVRLHGRSRSARRPGRP
ncbi:MAG: GNAT family N-acetyltransferase, partial [Elusimicrobia bacterium]|nr:GNAT family N-acetyltransferase [Elusimicrobiota bacterium]